MRTKAKAEVVHAQHVKTRRDHHHQQQINKGGVVNEHRQQKRPATYMQSKVIMVGVIRVNNHMQTKKRGGTIHVYQQLGS